MKNLSPRQDRRLIAQARHERQQGWRSDGLPGQIGAKPLADFGAEREAVNMAEPNISFGRGISHETFLCWSAMHGSFRAFRATDGAKSQDALPRGVPRGCLANRM